MKTLLKTIAMTGMTAAVCAGQEAPLAPLAPLPPDPPVMFLLQTPAAPPARPAQPAPPRGMSSEERERWQEAREREREAAERAREAVERVRERADSARESYREGQEALEERKYDRAIRYFERALERNTDRPDGAMYWKSYALYKLGRRDEAMKTLAEMQKAHPQSRWLSDAKALEVEVRSSTGQVSPESVTDEDLKLLAINALIHTEPERAIPLLEKVLNDGKASPRLKQRALFVLAQSGDGRARDIIGRYARGTGANPDLQLRAVEYLGAFGRREGAPEVLSEVYRSSNDTAVKRAVLRAYMVSREPQKLFDIAKGESNEDVKRYAIQMLGALRASGELSQLYGTESNVELRESILSALLSSGDSTKLLEIARSEKDPRVRRVAISRLGSMRATTSGDALAAMYATETDPEMKNEIITALYRQGAAKQLVDLARKESDLDRKGYIVKRLANMKSKDATDYLTELLSK